jgi:hypothetical protein
MALKLALPIALKLIPKGTKSLLICRIDLQKVQESGKNFFWKKPGSCPACNSRRLWGHGFALRYFFGFASGLWMKRWRCPDCGAVHTSRPADFLPGMQYPRRLQQSSLETKLAGKPYLKSIARQIQQYWWKTFLSRSKESENWAPLKSLYRKSLETGDLPVGKSRIYRAAWSTAVQPYLPFAVTVKVRPFSLE